MTDIRPEHMAAPLTSRCGSYPRCACLAEEVCTPVLAASIDRAIAAATADLTAERNALLVANGQLTTECAGLRITTGKLRGAADAAFADLCTAAQLCGMRDDEYPLKAIQRRIAELEKRAACGTCCGFGHVHMDRSSPLELEPAAAAHGGLPNPHEICDDCRPCPECGGEK